MALTYFTLSDYVCHLLCGINIPPLKPANRSLVGLSRFLLSRLLSALLITLQCFHYQLSLSKCPAGHWPQEPRILLFRFPALRVTPTSVLPLVTVITSSPQVGGGGLGLISALCSTHRREDPEDPVALTVPTLPRARFSSLGGMHRCTQVQVVLALWFQGPL